jgi:hypothetical protein
MVHGFGIVDVVGYTRTPPYNMWAGMINRCYSKTNRAERNLLTYDECSVCEEWKYFSNFLKWYEENVTPDGTLDKDILHKGNKIYSPEYCMIIPKYFNSLVVTSKKIRGNTPLGVHYNKQADRYQPYMKLGNKKHKCYGNFRTPEEAFAKYKEVKEAYIKEEADAWYNKGLITKKLRDALYNWTIEITD